VTAAPPQPSPYLDSSALIKLVVHEAESDALRRFLRAWPSRVSSALAAVEVPRAVRRLSTDARAQGLAQRVLAATTLLGVDETILAAAAALEPVTLRSLDAIHLASALALGSELGGLVTYDERLAGAARAAGVAVHAPR
jgi:predicted nucleic acid-binding protein